MGARGIRMGIRWEFNGHAGVKKEEEGIRCVADRTCPIKTCVSHGHSVGIQRACGCENGDSAGVAFAWAFGAFAWAFGGNSMGIRV